MQMYSKDEDCFELYKLLKRNLGEKIDFYGTPYTGLFEGKYYSEYEDDDVFEKGIPFYVKYCKGGFLRVSVGNYIIHEASVGEKLAALSSLYEALRTEFGDPTVFYTTKNDKRKAVSFQWSFINRKEEIQKFKDGTYFDDDEIDKLIIIDGQKQNVEGQELDEMTEKLISWQIGLPFDLLPLVDENIREFVKYKKGIEYRTIENLNTSPDYAPRKKVLIMY